MVVESWGGIFPTVDNVFLGGRVGGWEGVV